MESIKMAVVGSRTIRDYELVRKKINSAINSYIESQYTDDGVSISYLDFHIISGGAVGVDKDAIRYAEENNFHWTELLPLWSDYGKSAGFIRNVEIVEECDFLLCIWDGKSRGAKHSYDLAVRMGKPVFLYKNYSGVL